MQATQLAIKHALAGQPGPVAVLFAQDSLSGHGGAGLAAGAVPTRHYLPPTATGRADAARVAAAAQALLAAERPVVIAGNGVRIARAYEELVALAEAAGLPVATTAAGKGCFAETHGLALGVFGTFGTAAANACVAEADLVLAIGTKLGPERHRVGEPRSARSDAPDLHPDRRRAAQRVVDVPGRARAAGRRRAGAAAAAARRFGRRRPARREAGDARVADDGARRHGYFDAPELLADEVPILPQRVIGELMRKPARTTPSSPATPARTAS